MTRRANTPSDLEFFEARVVRPETPCWNWRAYVGKNGYGKWVRPERQASAHRVAYELFVGPIPEGMQLHHKCFNRSCVNPEHLEPVTAKENKAMSMSVAVINKAKTHCPKGHPLDGVNKRGRYCKTCNHETGQRIREKNPTYGRLARECKNGHPKTPENTIYGPDGKPRRCRLCRLDAKRKPGGYKDPNRERATHCPQGHEYTPENTYVFGNNYRSCRACGREKARAKAAR